MADLTEIFASNVFNDAVMKERLQKDVYDALISTVKQGKALDLSIANSVASAMKDWAVSKGATHYTHWFQPMTEITAEKLDGFISPTDDGRVIMEFSGKTLIKGEPDASSFPSGGLRATFEARGYTAWDPTSYAFVKDKCLFIPTAFCSYGGEPLDKKTPLLRSMSAINKQALRILKLFNNPAASVRTTVGPEQEYFLVDEKEFEKREDLIFTGRTLFGAKAPKGQEMEDHYFGAIKPRVKAFMEELDEELWKLGVLAKTEHNEVAPAQHELAPIFSTTNIATDHNQLTMELMKTVASRHGLVCLLHEKPFDHVNGSGKHNNWSISTDKGVNLLEPGATPQDNAQFLLFLCAVVKAVDEYQDLLRISVASAGNDHRLGANEAPPAIVSVFLGEELNSVIEAIDSGRSYSGAERKELKIGVDVLPKIPKDSTDRNRTSPFAFTGNKFEFRMVGSQQSIAGANIVLNTAVAEELRVFADELENADDFHKALNEVIKRTVREHKRIIFNGNGYDGAWVKEAERRGLLNLKTTPDALCHYLDKKNVTLFERHGVLSEKEMIARHEIILENYVKTVHIEALTMIDMARRSILPSVSSYEKTLAETISAKYEVGVDRDYEAEELANLVKLNEAAYKNLKKLECAVKDADKLQTEEAAYFYKDSVIPAMESLRAAVDAMEEVMPKDRWGIKSTYGDLMFSVK